MGNWKPRDVKRERLNQRNGQGAEDKAVRNPGLPLFSPPRSGLVQELDFQLFSHHDACRRRGRAGQETTARTCLYNLYKTNFHRYWTGVR